MLRFSFIGPFVILCAAVAFTSFFPPNARAQGQAGSEGMKGGYGGWVPPPTEEQRFQLGIRRVVKSLEQAETEEEKERLLELGRKGLELQYQRKLNERKAELEKLRRQLEQLETDYGRRVQAMPRIIDLQLESLKLASEGLLNLEDVIGRGRRGYPGGYGNEMGGYGMDYGGGMKGYGGGGGYGSEQAQTIKPGEDPFEGLGDEERKTPAELGGADRQGRTPTRPATIAEPPSPSTQDNDPFGAPSPADEDPTDAESPSEPSGSEPDDPFSF